MTRDESVWIHGAFFVLVLASGAIQLEFKGSMYCCAASKWQLSVHSDDLYTAHMPSFVSLCLSARMLLNLTTCAHVPGNSQQVSAFSLGGMGEVCLKNSKQQISGIATLTPVTLPVFTSVTYSNLLRFFGGNCLYL